MKQVLYKCLDVETDSNKLGQFVSKFIAALIVLNIFAVLFESYEKISAPYHAYLHQFEIFSIVIFCVEYIARIWTADLFYPQKTPVKARLSYIFSFSGIIDFVAIVPFFLPMVTTLDLRVLRSLRLVRLLRVFKLSRHSSSFKLLKEVMDDTKSDLTITLFVVFILLITSSTLMFYLENEAQPEAFSNIGQSLWWAVATLTTVGYGDIYPVTIGGKILSGFIAILGIGIVALPTSILSSSFIEKIEERKKKNKKKEVCTCPHCGKDFIKT